MHQKGFEWNYYTIPQFKHLGVVPLVGIIGNNEIDFFH